MAFAAVVFNPTKIEQEALAQLVVPAQQAAGWDESRWLPTQEDDPGGGMARTAVAEGAEVVLAVGGDGTVRAVAEGLRGSGVALAICPLGTGNLLARNLGIALEDLPGAVEATFGGVSRPIDLGLVEWTTPLGEREEHAFAVMAGMGLDAQIMANTDKEVKSRAGMLAYVQAGAIEVGRSRPMRLAYSFDGGPRGRARARMVVVGNCGSIGMGVYLMPDASLEDGRLDVVMAKPASLLGWLVVGWRVLVDNTVARLLRLPRATKRHDPFLSEQQCEDFAVEVQGVQEIQLDGDPFGDVVGARFRVAPGALLMRMPAPPAGR